jgi:tripartite-type tricarboxylate transporter receptor subunit TctC
MLHWAATGAIAQPAAADSAALATGPIRIVVPYPPGGVNDTVARVVAAKLAVDLGTPVIVDNKPGGGTIIGTQFVVAAKPDGHTLLMINPTTAINVSTQKVLPYDVNRDLVPVAIVATYPTLLVANPDVPAKTLAELIALAKARPGKLNFASGGYGGSTHLAGQLFNKIAGVDITHIPFKGSASTIQALVSGEVAISFGDFATYLPLVEAGKLRAIAVASSRRFPAAPNVPTMQEAGLPGFEVDVWLGIAAPGGTPPATVRRLDEALRAALGDPAVRDSLTRQGVLPGSSSPEAFRSLVKAEVDKWATVVREAGIEAQ